MFTTWGNAHRVVVHFTWCRSPTRHPGLSKPEHHNKGTTGGWESAEQKRKLLVCNIAKINRVTEGLRREGTKYPLPEYSVTKEGGETNPD